MEKAQKIEEALSIIWEEKERKISDKEEIKKKIYEKLKEDIFEELIKEGDLIVDNNSVRFSSKGEVIARDIKGGRD